MLTPREREIMKLVSDGKTNAEIGKVLWISKKTAKNHIQNIYKKLDVHNRVEAVLKYQKEIEQKNTDLKLIDILEQIEWQGVNSWGMERMGCPICGNEKEEGHQVDCKLGKVLEKVG